MKQVNIEVPIKVNDSITFTAKSEYSEPEHWEEINSTPENLKIYNAGLRMMKRNQLKSENNFAPLVERLVTMKVIPDYETALKFILTQKGIK